MRWNKPKSIDKKRDPEWFILTRTDEVTVFRYSPDIKHPKIKYLFDSDGRPIAVTEKFKGFEIMEDGSLYTENEFGLEKLYSADKWIRK